MRRLLPAIVTASLLLGLAALAPASALASGRVPRGVTRISVTLASPPKTPTKIGTGKSVHRTLRRRAIVREVVLATDALQTPRMVGACPMIVILGPHLTVVFEGAGGVQLAQAEVQVTYGSHGSSGSSMCFPIRYTSGTHSAALVGNSWVRLMGRLIGTAIS